MIRGLIATRKSYFVICSNISKMKLFRLPTAVDARFLRHLSRLRLNYRNKISFHWVVALLSPVFDQLTQLSLKLNVYLSTPDSLVVFGDTIQRLCMDHLDSLSAFALYLAFTVSYDSNDNSSFKVPFTNQQRPKATSYSK